VAATDKPPLIWSPEAIADLEAIWDFYAEAAGQSIAEKIVREIAETCRMVEQHPLIGRSRDEVRPGLRSLVSHPNVIFYRVRNDIQRSCASLMVGATSIPSSSIEEPVGRIEPKA
jgi:toxin ParE1/3/4